MRTFFAGQGARTRSRLLLVAAAQSGAAAARRLRARLGQACSSSVQAGSGRARSITPRSTWRRWRRRPAKRLAELVDFTNALCARYGIGWINEDVGFWSLSGRPLSPYPLPPLLDATGLRACVGAWAPSARTSSRRWCWSFPGSPRGSAWCLGRWTPTTSSRPSPRRPGRRSTSTSRHLLSWRWWRGWRGRSALRRSRAAAARSLLRAASVRLRGIAGDRFIDAHHGRLLDQQLTMLERLLPPLSQPAGNHLRGSRASTRRGRSSRTSARSLGAAAEGVVRPWAALRAPGGGGGSGLDAAWGASPRRRRSSARPSAPWAPCSRSRGGRGGGPKEGPAPPFAALEQVGHRGGGARGPGHGSGAPPPGQRAPRGRLPALRRGLASRAPGGRRARRALRPVPRVARRSLTRRSPRGAAGRLHRGLLRGVLGRGGDRGGGASCEDELCSALLRGPRGHARAELTAFRPRSAAFRGGGSAITTRGPRGSCTRR